MVLNNQIPKFAETLLSFYPTKEEQAKLLKKLDKLFLFWESNKEYYDFFSDPSISSENKKKFSEELLKPFDLESYFVNTILIIIDYQLHEFLGYFFENLQKQILEKLEITNVYIFSNIPIKKELKNRLEKQLNKKINKNLVFHYSIDASLIVGIRVQWDDFVEEYSLSTQMLKIDEELKKHLI